MVMKPVSRNTAAILAQHGLELDDRNRPQDEAAVLDYLKKTYPQDPFWSEEASAYLAVLTDCLVAMDERLYQYYRPVVDLFRSLVYTVCATADTQDPIWKACIQKGASLGLVDPGEFNRVPHLN